MDSRAFTSAMKALASSSSATDNSSDEINSSLDNAGCSRKGGRGMQPSLSTPSPFRRGNTTPAER